MASTTDGLRVLVTGAGSGIGAAIAVRLARAGYAVVGTVRDSARAQRLNDKARLEALPLEYRVLDLALRDQVEALASQLNAEGGIDVLVNNAGFGMYGALEDIEVDQVMRQFQVNVFGPLLLTQRLLPGLRQRRGRVVWIGSLAGRQSLAFQGHYSATKAAIASISDALRMELKSFGVRVTCVEPGDIASGFTGARVVVAGERSCYAENARRSLVAVEREERRGPDSECVARVVETLLTRRHPPSRIAAGRLGRTICLLLRLLPHAVGQFVAARRYGF